MPPNPTGLCVVMPSRLGVGETFALKVKVLGPLRPVRWNCFAWRMEGRYEGPFNRNARDFQYHDDILAEWAGELVVDGDSALAGPDRIVFDGEHQGTFPGDKRPVQVIPGYQWRTPGFHFIRLRDPQSGVEAWSNPVYVTAEPPGERIYWGDPHWQTAFSDGLRCPEELYAFARDEAFLDFGALSDHVEAITDRQWDYMTAVTNDFNAPGRFATLVGQEWTNFKFGHRNIYFRGDHGPVLRAIDPRCDTLDRLWAALAGIEALAIPHHSANVMMGVDWSLGWNPRFEKAVEIYSEWGSSECHADDGNLKPIVHCNGEKKGQHVLDALRRGYRFGFVGGGDVHDGRPGGGRPCQSPNVDAECHAKGLTAVRAPVLTREAVYDAIAGHATYAATQRGIYLDVEQVRDGQGLALHIRAASENGLREAVVIRNGEAIARLTPGSDARILETRVPMAPLAGDEFCYVRLVTQTDDMAWSSPLWGEH